MKILLNRTASLLLVPAMLLDSSWASAAGDCSLRCHSDGAIQNSRFITQAVTQPTFGSSRTQPVATAHIVEMAGRASVRHREPEMVMRNRPEGNQKGKAPARQTFLERNELLDMITAAANGRKTRLAEVFYDSEQSEQLISLLIEMLETQNQIEVMHVIMRLGENVPKKTQRFAVENYERLIQKTLLEDPIYVTRSLDAEKVVAMLISIWESDWFTKGIVSRQAQQSVESVLQAITENQWVSAEAANKAFRSLARYHGDRKTVPFLRELSTTSGSISHASRAEALKAQLERTIILSKPNKTNENSLKVQLSETDIKAFLSALQAWHWSSWEKSGIELEESKKDFTIIHVLDQNQQQAKFSFNLETSRSELIWMLIEAASFIHSVPYANGQNLKLICDWFLFARPNTDSTEHEIQEALASANQWHVSESKDQTVSSLLGLDESEFSFIYRIGRHLKTGKLVLIGIPYRATKRFGNVSYWTPTILIPKPTGGPAVRQLTVAEETPFATELNNDLLNRELARAGYAIVQEQQIGLRAVNLNDLTVRIILRHLGFKKNLSNSVRATLEGRAITVPYRCIGIDLKNHVSLVYETVESDPEDPNYQYKVFVAEGTDGKRTSFNQRQKRYSDGTANEERYKATKAKVLTRDWIENPQDALPYISQNHPAQALNDLTFFLEEIAKTMNQGDVIDGLDSFLESRAPGSQRETRARAIREAGFIEITGTPKKHIKVYDESDFTLPFFPSEAYTRFPQRSIIEEMGFPKESADARWVKQKVDPWENVGKLNLRLTPQLFRVQNEPNRLLLIYGEVPPRTNILRSTSYSDYVNESIAVTQEGLVFPIRRVQQAAKPPTGEARTEQLRGMGLEPVQEKVLDLGVDNVSETLEKMRPGDAVEVRRHGKAPDRTSLGTLRPELKRLGFEKFTTVTLPTVPEECRYIKLGTVNETPYAPDLDRFRTPRDKLLERSLGSSLSGVDLFSSEMDHSVLELVRRMLSDPEHVREIHAQYPLRETDIFKIGMRAMLIVFDALGLAPGLSKEAAKTCEGLINNASWIIYDRLAPETVDYYLAFADAIARSTWIQLRDAPAPIVASLVQLVETILIGAHDHEDATLKERAVESLQRIPRSYSDSDPLEQTTTLEKEPNGGSAVDAQPDEPEVPAYSMAAREALDHYYLYRYLFEKIARIPFMISPDDFLSEAKTLLRENPPDSNSNATNYQVTYKARLEKRLAAMAASRYGLNSTTQTSQLLTSVRELRAWIKSLPNDDAFILDDNVVLKTASLTRSLEVCVKNLNLAASQLEATRQNPDQLRFAERKLTTQKFDGDGRLKSNEEVASFYGVTLQTVETILSRAKWKMDMHLKGVYPSLEALVISQRKPTLDVP